MIFRIIRAVVLCLFTLFSISAGAVSAPDSEEQNTVGEIIPQPGRRKICLGVRQHSHGRNRIAER